MAGFDTGRVINAYDGELFAAPIGTALPADRDTALDAAFVGVGWITEDGMTFAPNVEAPDPIKGWPRGEIIKRPKPTLEPEFTFRLAQHDETVLDWVVTPDREMMVILDYKDTSSGENHRLVLPKVTVSEVGEFEFKTEDLVGVEVTVGCSRDDTAGFTFAFQIPDADGTGTTVKSY